MKKVMNLRIISLKNKIIVCVISLTLLLGSNIAYAGILDDAPEPPVISADGAILIDAKTGEVLFDQNMHKQKYPASTTKILTAILVMENLEMNDVITIDEETPYTSGSRIYLYADEEISVEELMYAMLVESANDAAVALAVAVAGSEDAFADMMNEKAMELGAQNSHFVNSNGLEDENHITSAYDLALFAKEAMKHDEFRKIVATYEHTIPPTNMQSEERLIHNTNRLLYSERNVTVNGETRDIKYDGATGIKSGYTSQAGSCLVASAERGDTEVIAVILETSEGYMYADAISLLDYGLDNFETVAVAEKSDYSAVTKLGDGDDEAVAVLTEDLLVTLPSDSANDMELKEEFNDDLKAPLKKGAEIGKLSVYYNGEEIASAPLVSESDVDKSGVSMPSFSLSKDTIENIIKVVLIIALAVILIILLYILSKRLRKVRKKRQGIFDNKTSRSQEITRFKRIK